MKTTFNFLDEPAKKDLLNFQKSIDRLTSQIFHSELPFVMGLYGYWGAGKSTYLRLLSNNLETAEFKRKFFTVTFEPWKLEPSDSLLVDIVSAIHIRALSVGATSKRGKKAEEKLFKHINEIGFDSIRDLLISTVSDISGHFTGAQSQVKALISQFLNLSPSEIAKNRVETTKILPLAFREYINSLNKTPVVLIDDLDRCTSTTVVELFEALKLFLQEEKTNIVYVLSMDHEMIIEAIQKNYDFDSWYDGWQYLSKICSVNWFIPRPSISGLLQSLELELSREGDHLQHFWSYINTEEIKSLFYICDLYLPRQLKRTIRQLHMVLSKNSLNLISTIKQILISCEKTTSLKSEEMEQSCYRFLLGIFMLREAYPDVFAKIAYKLYNNRVAFLLELSALSTSVDSLDDRIESVILYSTKWGLSELHKFLSDHIFLDLIGKLFALQDLLPNYAPEDIKNIKDFLINSILEPVITEMMSM